MLTPLLVLFMSFSFGQEKTISGNVTDQSGLPLPGVSIIVVGTTNGTQTDFDGNYEINASVGQVLRFSYLGQKTEERTVGSPNSINVQLADDAQALEEVVVVAYGTQKKDNLTSAVAVVKSETIENIPVASVDQILQGQVAGLNVNVPSGQPGQSGTILIRGRGSFNPAADIEPLFIIDNIPVDQDNFRALNPNDIESVSVLKDGSASALYGNRAANGVIIITTKKGTFNSAATITYRSQYGVSLQPSPNFDVLNSTQLLDYQAQVGSGLGATLSEAERAELGESINTNWEDIFLRDGITQSHELVIQGGGENTRSFTSMQYFTQEGISRRSDLNRFSLRNNTDVKGKRFSLSTNLQLSFSRSSFVVDRARGGNTGGQLDNPFIVPYIALPFLDAFNADGSLNTIGTAESGALNADGSVSPNGANGFVNTPFLALNVLDTDTDREDEVRIIGGINGTYDIAKNLKITSRLGIDYIQINNTAITSPSGIRGLLTPTEDSSVKGSRFENLSRAFQVNFNNSITYANTFNEKHSLSATALIEYNKNHLRTQFFQGFGLDSRIPTSLAGITDGNTVDIVDGEETRPFVPNVGGTTVDRGLFSLAGVVDYGFDDKYLFQASIRRDASSRFQGENEWGTFFGLSGRWNLHKESFLIGSDKVNTLALRLSYAELGNENLGLAQGNIFATQDLFALGTGFQGNPSIALSSLGNPDLTWETKKTINIGVDFGFFNNRLTGNLEFFRERTEDILFQAPIAPSSSAGFGNLNSNLGEIENRGIEFAFSYDLIRNDKVTLNLYGNTAFIENEVISIDGEQDFVENGLVTTLQVGAPFGAFYQQIWAGVNPANGEPLYLDADGNVTNVFNTGDRVLQTDKTRDPKFNGGFGANLRVGRFDFTSLFSYSYDVWRNNSDLGVIEDPNLVGFANQSTNVLRAWQQPGDITDIPAVGFAQRSANQSRYLRDASFLRLRNVQLGYTLDSDQLNGSFRSIRMYLLAQNLFTLTKWEGFDPESNQATSFFDFPVSRVFTVGFEVNF